MGKRKRQEMRKREGKKKRERRKEIQAEKREGGWRGEEV